VVPRLADFIFHMIKLMSFNIRYSQAEDGENNWERRKSLVMDRIRAFDPDLIGLQECRDDSQAEFIKAGLQEYELLGLPRNGNSATSAEMAPTLVKRSAFHIRQWETFWLSETPQIPGSKSWGSVFPRTVTWADISHLASGRALVFVNTHFDYEPSAIVASARMLKEWLGEAVGYYPLLLTGDFNTDKNSSAYQQMISGDPPLQDIFGLRKAEQSNEGTFHGYGGEMHPPAIDWILASEHFEVLSASIDRYHESRLYPSDHYPILATLDWKNAAP
jgi:endonuclease/exonuclease/phosphatase family metal-dependent hydrolase